MKSFRRRLWLDNGAAATTERHLRPGQHAPFGGLYRSQPPCGWLQADSATATLQAFAVGKQPHAPKSLCNDM
jgi:hypothetical protein